MCDVVGAFAFYLSIAVKCLHNAFHLFERALALPLCQLERSNRKHGLLIHGLEAEPDLSFDD
jgi:hypothetical protein